MTAADRIRARVKAGLERAGRRTGNDTPLTGFIVKPGALDESVYPPVQLPPKRTAVTLMIGNYDLKDAATSLVKITDVSFMIAYEPGLTIGPEDIIEIGSKRFSLSNVNAFQSGGEILYFNATGAEI